MTRIMLGFTHQQAIEYAAAMRWPVTSTMFLDETGAPVIAIRGEEDHEAERLGGLKVAMVGGIIWGPLPVSPRVRAEALARARL